MESISGFVRRWVSWRYRITSTTYLNSDPAPTEAAPDVAAELKLAVNAMKAEAFNDARARVGYAALHHSTAYADYRRCAARLRAFDPRRLESRAERLAFWINLYNALIVDAVIRFDVKNSIREVPGFLWRAAYCIGGARFSAFDIEYGILRANTGHPLIPGPHFGPNDPRRTCSLPALDPRIHFALVCGARSCPPIAVYDAVHIDLQLETAARAFVNNGGVGVDAARGEVRLSRIFQWYAPDFGGPPLGWGNTRPVLRCLAQWVTDVSDRQHLVAGDLRVTYTRYDWSLNG